MNDSNSTDSAKQGRIADVPHNHIGITVMTHKGIGTTVNISSDELARLSAVEPDCENISREFFKTFKFYLNFQTAEWAERLATMAFYALRGMMPNTPVFASSLVRSNGSARMTIMAHRRKQTVIGAVSERAVSVDDLLNLAGDERGAFLDFHKDVFAE